MGIFRFSVARRMSVRLCMSVSSSVQCVYFAAVFGFMVERFITTIDTRL